MKEEQFINKKIRLNIKGKEFYFTVTKIIELNDTHIIFLDKFYKEKMIRLKDISEVMEVK